MDYKYIKIFHEGGKTMGIRTYSNRRADQANEDRFPTEFEILQQGKMMAGKAALIPANLAEGYYSVEHFKPIYFAADVVAYGEDMKAKISRNCYEYVDPGEKDQ